MTAKTEVARPGSFRRLERVARTLSRVYQNPRHHNKNDPLDELVFILLSAKTAERSYLRTYRALKAQFPDWFDILSAPTGSVANLIAKGGLSRKKEGQIRSLLEVVQARGGSTFASLSEMPEDQAELYLTSLPGIGLKSARCVMMYSLGRRVFPVDTHCRRVLSRVGFVPFRRLTDRAQNQIQAIVPPELRHNLHVNLVAHGRAVCLPRIPKCAECPIREDCDYFHRGHKATPVGLQLRGKPSAPSASA